MSSLLDSIENGRWSLIPDPENQGDFIKQKSSCMSYFSEKGFLHNKGKGRISATFWRTASPFLFISIENNKL
jgi:hypothetical protein